MKLVREEKILTLTEKRRKKVTMLKNEVYFKVFKALYWLAKEEIASTKIASLLELIKKMGVDDLK